MNSSIRTFLSLLAIVGLSVLTLWGSDALTRTMLDEKQSADIAKQFSAHITAHRYDTLSVSRDDGVDAAYCGRDGDGNIVGYGVTVTVDGYVAPITVNVAISPDGQTVLGVSINKHNETAGYGARITNTVFLDRFYHVSPPLTLATASVQSREGVYRATAAEEEFGFIDSVELTVSNGEITAVNWDAVNAQGESKKTLSKEGRYVMSETGLPWHEQAAVMEQALLETQDPSALIYNAETGKTDAYSGATVRVGTFVKLAIEAFSQISAQPEGTPIDGLSGATVSSKAVITAVNRAAEWVRQYLKR